MSHEKVRFWCQRFGPLFAAEIRRRGVGQMRRSRCRCRCHKDEVFVNFSGLQHYLWRAVDHEDDVLDVYVSKPRDKKAALKFLRKLFKRHDTPEEFVA